MLSSQLFDLIQIQRQLQFFTIREEPILNVMGATSTSQQQQKCNNVKVLAGFKTIQIVIQDLLYEVIIEHDKRKRYIQEYVQTGEVISFGKTFCQIATNSMKLFAEKQLNFSMNEETGQISQNTSFHLNSLSSKIIDLCKPCKRFNSIFMTFFIETFRQKEKTIINQNHKKSVEACFEIFTHIHDCFQKLYNKVFLNKCNSSLVINARVTLANQRVAALQQVVNLILQSLNKIEIEKSYKFLIKQTLLSNKQKHKEIWTRNEPLQLIQRTFEIKNFQFIDKNFVSERKIQLHEARQYYNLKSSQWLSKQAPQNLTQYFLSESNKRISYSIYPSVEVALYEGHIPAQNNNQQSHCSIGARMQSQQQKKRRENQVLMNRREQLLPANRRRLN